MIGEIVPFVRLLGEKETLKTFCQHDDKCPQIRYHDQCKGKLARMILDRHIDEDDIQNVAEYSPKWPG